MKSVRIFIRSGCGKLFISFLVATGFGSYISYKLVTYLCWPIWAKIIMAFVPAMVYIIVFLVIDDIKARRLFNKYYGKNADSWRYHRKNG